MARSSLLIGDIGGTNARFAIADASGPGFSQVRTLNCRDFDSANLAIKAYLTLVKAAKPSVICLAAAGPIVNQSVRFTNNHWKINARVLGDDFDTGSVRILNDFEAIAYSIPFLRESDCMPIGLPPATDLCNIDFTVGIVGPGTGLGAVGLIKRDSKLFPIVGEAGHVGFAPETPRQIEILAALRERFGRVSDERLVSGPGLEHIYRALIRIQNGNGAQLTAAEIFAEAADNSNLRAIETVQIFFEILGQVAGNLALTFGAADGLYIAGGISRRYPQMLQASGFRSAFESKGRHRALMERIPTLLITSPEPGLLGASYCALQMADP